MSCVNRPRRGKKNHNKQRIIIQKSRSSSESNRGGSEIETLIEGEEKLGVREKLRMASVLHPLRGSGKGAIPAEVLFKRLVTGRRRTRKTYREYSAKGEKKRGGRNEESRRGKKEGSQVRIDTGLKTRVCLLTH